MTEREAMELCLELARKGWGRVSPSPLVGAVLLKDGVMVGEGHYAEFGGSHSEVVALEIAGAKALGSTCVVNLEPCSHYGKTPPCTDALISAGVARVVIANLDPNPEAGGGRQVLADAGIDVEAGAMAEEAAALNAHFLWYHTRPSRPFVAVKLATSIDGYIADSAGDSKWISGSEARNWVQQLRAGFDAIAVGRKTASADNPALTVRGKITPRHQPRRLIFTRSGQIDANLKVLNTPSRGPAGVVNVGQTGLSEGDRGPDGHVQWSHAESLVGAFEDLRKQGVASVLCEGGASFAGELFRADLVDRMYWIQSPKWLGDGVRAFCGLSAGTLSEAKSWVVTERRTLGEDTLLVLDKELCLPAS